MKKILVAAFVTLGVGKIPWAPGTWGSLVGLALWWLIQPDFVQGLIMIFLTSLAGFWAVHSYEKQSGAHDPKEVIIDEVIGMWITLLAFPTHFLWLSAGFILFRLFDIWKPFPIGWLDRKVGGALGTILDDVVAGLFAGLGLFIITMTGYFSN